MNIILGALMVLIGIILLWGIPGSILFMFIGFVIMHDKFEEFLDGDKRFFDAPIPAITTIICGPIMWFAVFMTRRENQQETMSMKDLPGPEV